MAELILLQLSKITLLEHNPRAIDDADIDQLCQDIEEDPEFLKQRPPLINQKGKQFICYAGQQRVKACLKLGRKEIFVFMEKNVPKKVQDKRMVLDNTHRGRWDIKVLMNEYDFKVEELVGFGIPETSFNVYGKGEATEDNYEIPDEIQTNIVLGDLITIGTHRLLCGDSTNADDVKKVMDGAMADICFTSPPYNMGGNAKVVGNKHTSKRKSQYENNSDAQNNYIQFLNFAIAHSLEVCHAMALNIQMLAGNKTDVLEVILRWKNKFVDIITWDKSRAQPAIAKNVLNSAFEWIVIFSKSTNTRALPMAQWRGNKSNVYSNPPQTNNEFSEHHGATFPMHLPAYIISEIFNLSKSVYDPFIGSGTTMVASQQLDRICYAIEIEPKYCQIIIDRMLKSFPELPVKVNGKKYKVPANEN